MPNLIDQASARSKGSVLLVCFTTGGFPDAKTGAKLINQLPKWGADVVEIGMPFSDASADGSSIRDASKVALEKGIKLKDILAQAASFRKANPETPLILMGYYNPILTYGCKKFATDAYTAGVNGLIVVDLPPEEEEELTAHLNTSSEDSIYLIHLITPTTSKKRLAYITGKGAKGFFYYVSVTGTTGTKTPDLSEVAAHLKELAPSLPVAIGFGIREPEQVTQFGKLGQAVVIGSALIDSIKESWEKMPGDLATLEARLGKQIAAYKAAT